MMRRIVYISTAVSLPASEIERILESATRNNAVMGITGFLLYNGRNFLQLVEGEQAALLSLMVTLRRDVRHSGVTVMIDEPIAERCCPEWRMHQIRLVDNVVMRRSSLEEELPVLLAPYPRTLVENFAMLN